MIFRLSSTALRSRYDLPVRSLHRIATFILAAFAASLSADRAIQVAFAGSAPAPNIVLILADDMGFSDAGCYGGEIGTPNLDRLAQGGVRFTQFYNTARCWPSRASILTGYYAQQVRRDGLPGLKIGGFDGKRPAWARLLPELLRPLGYRTYHSGKWHVDGLPLAGGFDRSFDYSDNDRHFLPAARYQGDDRPLEPLASDEGYYASTAEADHAIRQLRDHAQQHAGRPFFLYLAFTEPHFPVQAPREDIDIYRRRYLAGWDALRQERWQRMTAMGLINCPLSPLDPDIIPGWNLSEKALQARIGPGEAARAVPWSRLTEVQQQFQPIKMAIHAAMIHRMDTEIGRVLAQLKAMDAFENTVIFFLSDNGASAEQMIRGDGHDRTAPAGSAKSFLCIGPGWSSAANTPLRLHKSWVHEGGITTPLIVHWPRGIAARGELRHDPGHLIDLAPTILELAGGRWPPTLAGRPVPPPPGKSLVPSLAKDGSVAHDYLWWYHIGNRAIRVGDWKLVAAKDSPWELYDLRTDRSESRNLAAQKPDKVRELEGAWTRHLEEFRRLALEDLPPAKKGEKAKAR
jgi:arylsulfatase